MEKELADILRWLGDTIEVYSFQLGEYRAMIDYNAQVAEHRCLGCPGTGISKWPEWKVTFTHTPDCLYQKLMRLIATAQAELEQAGVDSSHTDAG